MTIKIKDKDYKIKQTIRSIFLWEQITGKTFEVTTTLDNYLYFYCLLLANNEDFMNWDDFLNDIDEDPTILMQLTKALINQNELEKMLNPESDEESGDKKKD